MDVQGKNINEAIAKLSPLMGRPSSVQQSRAGSIPEFMYYEWIRYEGAYDRQDLVSSNFDTSAGYVQKVDVYQNRTVRRYCRVVLKVDSQDVVVDYEVSDCGGFLGAGNTSKWHSLHP